MPHRLRDGLIDYLEIMRLSGVSDLGPPVRTPVFEDEPVDDNPVDKKIEAEISESAEIESDTELKIDVKIINDQPDEENLPKLSKAQKIEQLDILAKKVARCTLCEELALSRTQTVFGVGNPNSKLVFLGEAPGADEDKRGEPFVGRAGQLLTDIITKGMKLKREDVYICNILRCRPPGNRNPLPEEAEHCRPFLDATLEIVRPKFICCLGAVAAKNLLDTKQSIGALRGNVLEYQASYGTVKVVCTYHPAYLLRDPAAKKLAWEDIKLLMREMGLPVE